MTEASSPTVWRRWLAFELARLRREAGLEQKDVAKALRCTIGKVSYYETAERPVVVRDLDEVLLPLYEVPQERWPLYLQAAKDSRQKGWWARYDEAMLPSWFALFVGLEQGAIQIRTCEELLIPGLLQTRDYAEAVFRRGVRDLSDEEIGRKVEPRMARQGILSRESTPVQFSAVLGEAVLRRAVGGPLVMRDQLRHLVDCAVRPNITIRVLPFDLGYHAGLTGSFEILNFPLPSDPGVVYLEYRTGALYLEQADQIEDHVIAFEHSRLRALSPDDSVVLMRTIAKETR